MVFMDLKMSKRCRRSDAELTWKSWTEKRTMRKRMSTTLRRSWRTKRRWGETWRDNWPKISQDQRVALRRLRAMMGHCLPLRYRSSHSHVAGFRLWPTSHTSSPILQMPQPWWDQESRATTSGQDHEGAPPDAVQQGGVHWCVWTAWCNGCSTYGAEHGGCGDALPDSSATGRR